MKRTHSTSFEDARSVLKILLDHGHHAMFAGGCVRDRLLGTRPHDYDIASDAPPSKARTLFEDQGYRVIPTGIDHGTITVISQSGPVEITTLRKDVKTDGRHAIVSFDNATFEDDAARRDFTINAMFEDIDGNVHDFHRGKDDLKKRLLSFVGDPVERIREDYLRILRFFRFWARLGFTADPKALNAIKSEALGLGIVSQERITTELWGIFSAEHAAEPIQQMEQTGVIKLILPNAPTISHKISLILRDAGKTNDHIRPWIVFSVLLGILGKNLPSADMINQTARTMRLSEKQTHTLQQIFQGWQNCVLLERDHASALLFAEHLESTDHQYDLISFFGPIWLFLARHENDSVKSEQIGWLIAADQTFQEMRKMQLPINGKDVMELRPELKGRQIGDAVLAARRAFLNRQWQTRHDGLQFLKSLNLPAQT